MKKINLKEVFHSRKKALILLTFVAIIVGVLIFNWRYFEEMLSENKMANNRQGYGASRRWQGGCCQETEELPF